MDLKKVVDDWRQQPSEQWLAQLNRFLPPLAVALLVILLAFQAAGLTWRLLEQPADQDELPPLVVLADPLPAAGGAGNLQPLRGWEPFGSAPEQTADAISADDILDAPPTRLPLKLTSTVQRQELPERGSMVIPEAGTAIIESARGTEKPYRTGETIEDANGATLHSVFTDSVRIQPAGGGPLERLDLPKADAEPGTAARSVARPTLNSPAPFRSPPALGSAAAVTEAASTAAVAFGQHIQLRMQLEGDQVLGFRVEPRGDSPVLSRLGLEPGDVLTQVNGIRLGDLRNATAVMEALAQSPQANVVVRRNGVDQPMVIDLGQIQRLAESLQ